MSAKQNNSVYKGVFEGMDFPPYQYEHYPVLMRKPGVKQPLRVTSPEEEESAKADGYALPPGVGAPVVVTQQDLAAKDSEIEELRRALEDAKAALAAKAGAAATPAAPAKA